MKSNVPDNVPDKRIDLVLDLIKKNNQIQLKELSKTLKVSTRTIRRDLEKLKSMNKLKRIGSEKSGFWKIINDDN
jgi:ATP-dependent DNA helicase RecG